MFNSMETLKNIQVKLDLDEIKKRLHLESRGDWSQIQAIIDPTDKQLYVALKASLMLAGKDEFCMEYITAFREGGLG